MLNEDQTGPGNGPLTTAASPTKRDANVGAIARAQARRVAFKTVMNRAAVTPTELARLAGLSNPNSIYNFLNGRSSSLSQATMESILAALPGVTQEVLTGNLPRGEPAFQPGNLWAASRDGWPVLTAEAEAGVWRRSARLAPARWALVPMPSDLPPPGPAAFAVRLKGTGADGLYPQGTTAVCLPLTQMLPAIRSGCRVLVRRERAGRHELTVQKLMLEESRAWLWPYSSDPAHQAATALPWPLYGPVALGTGADEMQISIEGVVIATWQPEAALGLP